MAKVSPPYSSELEADMFKKGQRVRVLSFGKIKAVSRLTGTVFGPSAGKNFLVIDLDQKLDNITKSHLLFALEELIPI